MKYTVFSTSLCLCIFCLILLSRNSSAADYRYEACTPRVCGNVQNIKFPFYIEGLQESYCGQPGFQLNCSNHGYPTISFSGNDYIVENISYPSRSIRVYNAAVSSTSKGRCLSQISNTTPPVSEFRYVNETAALHLLSNCTEPLSKDLLQYKFVCEGEKSNNLDLAIWDKDENLQNGLKSCKKNVVVPVEVYGDVKERIRMRNYEEILRRGFALNWLAGYNCSRCERYGGRCGFNTTTYSARCFCPDGSGERHCRRKVPDISQPVCGLFTVECNARSYARLQPDARSFSPSYEILSISTNQASIRNPILDSYLQNKSCRLFSEVKIPDSQSISLIFFPNITLTRCPKNMNSEDDDEIRRLLESYNRNYTVCDDFDIYYANLNEKALVPNGCSVLYLPLKSQPIPDSADLFERLAIEYNLEWHVSDDCINCHRGGGKCSADADNQFRCLKEKNKLKLILLITVIPGSTVILCVVGFLVWRHKRRINDTYLLSRNISSDPSSKSDNEGGSFYYGIPIFSYTELEVATNNFDTSKELGDGGFGTVYYGKLRDGREVAIKRLYEHNYKRVEQFMNEIKILTCLRHPNLVSLYGCTSRRSQELLLVYEYVSKGTVADHIHGDGAKESPLSWPIRMNIAMETASALAYLHASDIIHRDVKTNNILLDDIFSVKVADFGLSRLFPNDVTHISTAPQGTPGYVDPEYHQCYQLTSRSDVYSFGVVLVELISSMPAVDISRHRHEINLANLAISRIQRCAFNELIDPSLGYGSDAEVTRMTTSVAELAFRCLQLQTDLRPSMDEVLAFLRDIRGDTELETEKKMETNENHSVSRGLKIPPSPETDDVLLLKSKYLQSSPNAVTDKWISGSTTASSSG